MTITHLDKRKNKRKGWFNKGKDAKPAHKNYRKSCKAGNRGFQGPRSEAHHVVPQTSIEESKEEYINNNGGDKDTARYVNDVQYITDWNINDPHNMVGLPTFHSYEQYFQLKEKLDVNATGNDTGKDLIKWFNKFSKKTRKKWLKEFQAGSTPEKNCIHNPVSWGHAKYNDRVKVELVSNVWDQIQITRNDHSLDAAAVQTELNNMSDTWYGRLVSRASKATLAQWKKRAPGTDWYEPFTMADISDDPLYG